MDEQITSRINDKVNELKALANHIITEEELKEAVDTINSEAKKLVQDNPIPVLLGAVALGFILGKIIKR
jgi:ElaB/YqjD/DUF883 family membrane-anchored ribosome-binding protein